MTKLAAYRELTALGLMAASYPLDRIAEGTVRPLCLRYGEPVILVHGFGGNRAHLLGLETYLRAAGFGNLMHFEYPRSQALATSVHKLGEAAAALTRGSAVHLIGHSLGGYIAREYAKRDPRGVRSLITLGSPYWPDQESPTELAIFGEEDPLIAPPRPEANASRAFKHVIILRATGHFGLLYHPRTLQSLLVELRHNRQ